MTKVVITAVDDFGNIQMLISLKMGDIFPLRWEERPLEYKSLISVIQLTLQPSGKLFKRNATANPLKNLPPRKVDIIVV